MKVVRYHEFGDESVLKYEDVPDPEPGPGEVLINVTAASVNRGEVTRRKGTRAVEAAFPIQPGWDTAGTVAGLGSGVSDLTLGQRVVGWLATGGYAERVVATRTDVVPTPDNVSDDEAPPCRPLTSPPGLPSSILLTSKRAKRCWCRQPAAA